MEIDDISQFLKKFKKESGQDTRLDLSNKDIIELPEEIGELQQLEYINLSYNSLSSLPKGLFSLKKLKTLLLVRNELTELPREIGHLKNLELLDVSYNSLISFPSEIGNLPNLSTIDAGYNKIKTLPLEFIKIVGLKKLFLENNPMECPPEKVVKRGIYATMLYLSELNKKADAIRVFIQIFNLPSDIQESFEEYTNHFKEVISSLTDKEIKFDYSFIAKVEKK